MKRRIRKCAVSQLAFVTTARVGNEIHAVVTSGLPVGAKYVGSTFDDERLEAYLFYEHESFDEIEETDPVPTQEIVFKRLP